MVSNQAGGGPIARGLLHLQDQSVHTAGVAHLGLPPGEHPVLIRA
jgi:hypothetical protein